MLAYWDSTSRCRFANRAYERWFGVSPEALIGKHISELLGPLYQLNLPYIEAALRGVPQEFEREIPNPSGGPPRYSLANYIPEVVDGVVRGFFVTVTDISEVKRAQEALRRSEAMFSGIISISADAIVSIDETQRITMFNEGAERAFGYAKAEILGSPVEVLLPERFRLQHRQHVERFAAGHETTLRFGVRRIVGLRKNGEEFPADASLSKLDVGGTMVLTVSLRDVSEQRRVDDEQRLLAKVGKTLVAAGADVQRLLTDVAKALADSFAGWCTVDIVQAGDVRRVKVVHSDEAMAATCTALERYSARREQPGPVTNALETQGSVLMSDVTPADVESLAQSPEHLRLMRSLDPGSFIVVPLAARGHALGMLGIGASRASRRLGHQDVRLLERVASRVALAVDNAQLHEALQRAVRARDDVLGIVAHDLRNPLSSIMLTAQALRRRDEPERRDQKASERIHRAATRMNRLIQDLLDVTRLEAGQSLTITQETVAAASVLAEAVEQQQAVVRASDRVVEVDAPGVSPSVWADRARLLQVFDNLLGNAIKFARRRITLGVRLEEGDALFWVGDDGVGVSAENQQHLFDRFWQARKEDRRGAGLGLSIVKGIVEVHGGRVWVKSEVGVGTTFYFTLPVAPRAATQAAEEPPA